MFDPQFCEEEQHWLFSNYEEIWHVQSQRINEINKNLVMKLMIKSFIPVKLESF